MESLADYFGLNTDQTKIQDQQDNEGSSRGFCLEDIQDPRAFARAVLESREFRAYIVAGLTLGNLPGFTSILGRLMDIGGFKVADRIEHTGKDGDPIITEVRRVIVRVREDNYTEQEDVAAPKYPTH
jgi:hypothetical protein